MSSEDRDRPYGGRPDRERLERLLGDPQLEWLVARARRRIELGQPLEGIVTLADATPSQRLAVKRLLGKPPRAGRALRVSLQEVDEVVRRSGASPDGLASAVAELTGPIAVRGEVIAAERRAWEKAFEPLDALLDHRLAIERDGSERSALRVGEASPLARWIERLRDSGVVKRMQGDPLTAADLLRHLAAVIAALPSDGEPLGAFAARVAGGAHALDEGEPLATLALGAVRALAGLHDLSADESPAESRRQAWAAVGVLCDELSSTVLTLCLPGEQETGTGRLLELSRAEAQPIWLTLRQLARDPPAWADAGVAGQTIYICENPVVVALAAEKLRSGCNPLVCTSGQPGAATITLLRGLADAGARLVHHGDFDWGGIRIGNVLHARLGSPPRPAVLTPWRFDAQTYLRLASSSRSSSGSDHSHLARAGVAHAEQRPSLAGRPVPASWDPSLMEAMLEHGQRIEEENMIEELLADLSR